MRRMINYGLIQGFYWMIFCCAYGYNTYFLMGRGFTTAEIGTIAALFGLLGAMMQTVLGRMTDNGTIRLRTTAAYLMIANTIFAIALTFCDNKLLNGILFGLILSFTNAIMPLVNRLGFEKLPDRAGLGNVNFGVARGIGSLSYAIVSMILGILTVKFGIITVPISLIAIFIAITCSLLMGRTARISLKSGNTQIESSNRPKSSIIGLVKKYPVFLCMCLSVICLMASHNIANTFLLNICERIGGDSGDMGTALAIAAVCELPVMFGFTIIYRKFTASKLLFFSTVGFTLKAVAYLLSSNITALLAAQLIQVIGFALYASSSIYYADEVMEEEDKTTGQALMASSNTLGSVLGSLFGGMIIQSKGVGFALTANVCIAAAGFCIALISTICNRKG